MHFKRIGDRFINLDLITYCRTERYERREDKEIITGTIVEICFSSSPRDNEPTYLCLYDIEAEQLTNYLESISK